MTGPSKTFDPCRDDPHLIRYLPTHSYRPPQLQPPRKAQMFGNFLLGIGIVVLIIVIAVAAGGGQ